MDVTFRSTCLGLATLFALGCGSGNGSATTYPPQVDAGQQDAITANDSGSDTSKPAPMSSADSVPLFAGTTALLSSGAACTSEVGAVGDRWCAFIALSKTNIGNVDLFVVNVSQAATGVSISCGGTNGDPNCLRLTGGYFEDSTPNASHTALFRGDTLVYFDRTGAPYGWRPGMANGRALALNKVALDVHDCLPASKGTAVYCLQDLTVGDVTQSDLLLGRLDGAVHPPLARVETVISSNIADGTRPRFQVGFPTPAGDTLAWSGRATPTGPEILKVQKVDDASTRATVATDVNRWTTSPDGGQWYWLSQFGTTSGTLQGAPFPAGASPTTLISNVAEYRVAATGGIVARTTARELQGIVDPVGAPTTIVPLDTGVLGIVQISGQGHVAYAKNIDSILGLIDLYVKKLDGMGARCTLTSQQNSSRFAAYAPGSGAILWARTDLNAPFGDPPDGLYTSLSDCRTTTVAPGIADLRPAADVGVLIVDEFDGVDGRLRVQGVTDGHALGSTTPVLIQTRVDSYLTVSPSSRLVIYTVNAGSPADGVYVYSVAGVAPSGMDAGTGDAATGGASDAGVEGGGDAAPETAGDAGTDAGNDAAPETAGDAGTDAGDDAATGVPGDA